MRLRSAGARHCPPTAQSNQHAAEATETRAHTLTVVAFLERLPKGGESSLNQAARERLAMGRPLNPLTTCGRTKHPLPGTTRILLKTELLPMATAQGLLYGVASIVSLCRTRETTGVT